MLNIVLFGAPGCGKGTQAGLMQEKFGLLHVSTGDIIRKEIAAAAHRTLLLVLSPEHICGKRIVEA